MDKGVNEQVCEFDRDGTKTADGSFFYFILQCLQNWNFHAKGGN